MVRGVAWSAVARFGSNLLTIIVTVVLARMLGPEPFGAIAIFLVVVGYANILADVGLTASIIQKENLEPEDVVAAFWLNLVLGTAISLALLGLANPLAALYDMEDLRPLVQAASAVVWLTAITAVQRSNVLRNLRFKRLAALDLGGGATGGVCAVAAAIAGWGATALPVFYIVRAAVSSAGFWWLSDLQLRGRPEWGRLRGLGKFSGAVALNRGIGYAVDNLDRAVLGAMVPAASLAQFDQARRLSQVPVQGSIDVVGRVFFPALSRLQRDPKLLADTWVRGVTLTSVVAYPAALGVFAVARPLVLTLFGPEWEPMVALIRILSLVGLFTPVSGLAYNLVFAQGKAGLWLRINLVRRSYEIAFLLLALPHGVMAVACAPVAAGSLSVALDLWVVRRCAPVDIRRLLRGTGGNALQAGVMAAVVWAICGWLEPHMHIALVLAIGVGTGVITYAALAWTLALEGTREATDMVLQRLRRAA